ncbi:hypothetical protein E2C01_029231 [Portunus trituberculatus]|uniref:Uncharacterized protein n=1 Tax=Portunus trituberculatus TaxID=210409 RepID=A0A5B7EU33_PORTR|nr:hypothetical protein [Portunus trituberculatus]
MDSEEHHNTRYLFSYNQEPPVTPHHHHISGRYNAEECYTHDSSSTSHNWWRRKGAFVYNHTPKVVSTLSSMLDGQTVIPDHNR